MVGLPGVLAAVWHLVQQGVSNKTVDWDSVMKKRNGTGDGRALRELDSSPDKQPNWTFGG